MNLIDRPLHPARRPKKMSLPLALAWSHCGISYRVTPWPDVQVERLYGDEWIPATAGEDVLASAAQACGAAEWRPYLDFVPGDVRAFLELFSFKRLDALLVAARCPGLLLALSETPALTAFVAAHQSLRGREAPGWDEINAVFDRADIFGVLEWLGLPASRQTLAILQNMTDPGVPHRLLEPLRTMLWEPRAIFALQRMPGISDHDLARTCHALAA